MSTTMDTTQTTLHEKTSAIDYSSTVDTSRPFRSVKEAVEIFGERLLTGELYSHNNHNKSYNSTPIHFPKQEITPSWKFSPTTTPSPKKPSTTLVDTLKKLEAELEETKVELKLLKERESETEVALASLNAELHKNMSRMAEAEAAAARKAVLGGGSSGGGIREGERRRDLMVRMEQSSTLAEILSIGEKQGSHGYVFNGGGGKKEMRKNMMKKKKKPIIPLIVDLFSWKKGSSTALHNHLFSSF